MKKIISNKYILIFIIFIFYFIIIYNIRIRANFYNKYDYNKKFVIIIRDKNINHTFGLLAIYYVYIGCVNEYIKNGFIPIIDLSSCPNLFNNFNISTNINPWENFFFQPFNYNLKDVKHNSKNIKYVECYQAKFGTPYFDIFYNEIRRNFWHKIAKKYIPIKEEILREAKIKFKLLFNNSNNILGILIRGTDYIGRKFHAIQPKPDDVFKDINEMDNKYNYDYIFMTTEDDIIREKFIKTYGGKLKYIKPLINIKYDYNKKELLAFNKEIKGNLSFMKIYLINIIILSKCIDIISSQTAGSIVAFILSKGFRNKKIYNLGYYK